MTLNTYPILRGQKKKHFLLIDFFHAFFLLRERQRPRQAAVHMAPEGFPPSGVFYLL